MLKRAKKRTRHHAILQRSDLRLGDAQPGEERLRRTGQHLRLKDKAEERLHRLAVLRAHTAHGGLDWHALHIKGQLVAQAQPACVHRLL
jgi:hypothetical protein